MAHITLVEVLKRYPIRFHSIVARIGETRLPADHVGAEILINEECARFDNATEDMVGWFNCSQVMTGRYLTLQTVQWTFLEADEVYVHRGTI